MEFDDALLDNPKTGALLLAEAVEELPKENAVVLDVEDPPKENPVDGDVELNVEPNMGDFAGGQLDRLGVEPLLELTALASEEEAEPFPIIAPEPNRLEAEVEPKRELPLDKVVLPATAKDGEDVEEPN